MKKLTHNIGGFWNWDWKPKKDLSFLTFSWISRSTTSLPLVCPMEGKEVGVNKVCLLVYFSNVDFPAVDFGFFVFVNRDREKAFSVVITSSWALVTTD